MSTMTKQEYCARAARLGSKIPKSWTKSRIIKEFNKVKKARLEMANLVIDQDFSFNAGTFYKCPDTHQGRKNFEAENNWGTEVTLDDNVYTYFSDVRCENLPYNRIVYKGTFKLNDRKITQEEWKKMVNILETV